MNWFYRIAENKYYKYYNTHTLLYCHPFHQQNSCLECLHGWGILPLSLISLHPLTHTCNKVFFIKLLTVTLYVYYKRNFTFNVFIDSRYCLLNKQTFWSYSIITIHITMLIPYYTSILSIWQTVVTNSHTTTAFSCPILYPFATV